MKYDTVAMKYLTVNVLKNNCKMHSISLNTQYIDKKKMIGLLNMTGLLMKAHIVTY